MLPSIVHNHLFHTAQLGVGYFPNSFRHGVGFAPLSCLLKPDTTLFFRRHMLLDGEHYISYLQCGESFLYVSQIFLHREIPHSSHVIIADGGCFRSILVCCLPGCADTGGSSDGSIWSRFQVLIQYDGQCLHQHFQSCQGQGLHQPVYCSQCLHHRVHCSQGLHQPVFFLRQLYDVALN